MPTRKKYEIRLNSLLQDVRLQALCDKLGLDVAGVFNYAIAKLADAEGVADG